jgi:hypothetical protein
MKMDWKAESEKSSTFEVYPEGGYILRVSDWEKIDASTGTPQIRVHFTVVQPDEFTGKTFIDHFALTEKALWRVAMFVSRCGIDTSTMEAMEVGSPAFIQVLNQCKKRQIGAMLVIDKYNGKTKNKVEEYHVVEKQKVAYNKYEGDDVPDFLKKQGAGAEDEDNLI